MEWRSCGQEEGVSGASGPCGQEERSLGEGLVWGDRCCLWFRPLQACGEDGPSRGQCQNRWGDGRCSKGRSQGFAPPLPVTRAFLSAHRGRVTCPFVHTPPVAVPDSVCCSSQNSDFSLGCSDFLGSLALSLRTGGGAVLVALSGLEERDLNSICLLPPQCCTLDRQRAILAPLSA